MAAHIMHLTEINQIEKKSGKKKGLKVDPIYLHLNEKTKWQISGYTQIYMRKEKPRVKSDTTLVNLIQLMHITMNITWSKLNSLHLKNQARKMIQK